MVRQGLCVATAGDRPWASAFFAQILISALLRWAGTNRGDAIERAVHENNSELAAAGADRCACTRPGRCTDGRDRRRADPANGQHGGDGSRGEAAKGQPGQDEALTMFPHSETAPWFVAGQANIIFQAHPSFHSPYQGKNSLHGAGEYKTSLLGTLFLGYQLGRGIRGETPTWSERYNTDFIADFESSGGRGLSQALGLAGFTNLDVVRNPNLGSKPYVARVEFHQTIGFTNEMTEVERGPWSLATEAPVRRLDLRLGKMSLPDVMDINDVLSDSHLQFTNWTVDNNGTWDYAADTRGYTYAGVIEYQDRNWAARYVLAAMPVVANGIDLDWALSRARGQNWEFELRHGLLPGHKGTQRVLAFVNNAHMGDYREAVRAYVDGIDPTPEITKHEHFGAVKYGFGYSAEQQVTETSACGRTLRMERGPA